MWQIAVLYIDIHVAIFSDFAKKNIFTLKMYFSILWYAFFDETMAFAKTIIVKRTVKIIIKKSHCTFLIYFLLLTIGWEKLERLEYNFWKILMHLLSLKSLHSENYIFRGIFLCVLVRLLSAEFQKKFYIFYISVICRCYLNLL